MGSAAITPPEDRRLQHGKEPGFSSPTAIATDRRPSLARTRTFLPSSASTGPPVGSSIGDEQTPDTRGASDRPGNRARRRSAPARGGGGSRTPFLARTCPRGPLGLVGARGPLVPPLHHGPLPRDLRGGQSPAGSIQNRLVSRQEWHRSIDCGPRR